MECRTAVKGIRDIMSVHLNLIEDRQRGILYPIEVGIVAITLPVPISIFPIPLSILDTKVLGRNKLRIETTTVLLKRLFVLLFEDTKNMGNPTLISFVVTNFVLIG